MKIAKQVFALVLCIVLLSCASTQQVTNEVPPIQESSKLLFLNYRVEKNEDKKSISLINQILTDGRLKQSLEINQNPDVGDLECVVLDDDYNNLETYHIKNPLRKIVEFINDSGHLEKKILDLDYAEFSLKLQLNAKAKHIQINEISATEIIEHSTTKIE